MWGRVHMDSNLISSGPAVEDSGERVAASTGTGTGFPQDPWWRTQEDVWPFPQEQESSLLRTRYGGFGRMWAYVHMVKSGFPLDLLWGPQEDMWPSPTDKNQVFSGRAMEALGGCGAMTTPREPSSLRTH